VTPFTVSVETLTRPKFALYVKTTPVLLHLVEGVFAEATPGRPSESAITPMIGMAKRALNMELFPQMKTCAAVYGS